MATRALWWVVEELGPAACSLCVWACGRTSLTELLPLEDGVTAGLSWGWWSGAVSVCMRCWAHSARHKWELKAIAVCLGGERGTWGQCLPCPAEDPMPPPLPLPPWKLVGGRQTA